MKVPATKDILNVTLIIGTIIVGKKVLEFLGVLKTEADANTALLDTGSTGDITDVSPTAPVGLSLNPLYRIEILKAINRNLVKKGKPQLTGLQIYNYGQFEAYRPSATLSIKEFFFNPAIEVIYTQRLIQLEDKMKKLKFVTGQDRSYIFLAFQIFEAKGIFTDTPPAVLACFQKLKSRYQVSLLSYFFTVCYGQDITAYMLNYLDSNEMNKIYESIKNKPLI